MFLFGREGEWRARRAVNSFIIIYILLYLVIFILSFVTFFFIHAYITKIKTFRVVGGGVPDISFWEGGGARRAVNSFCIVIYIIIYIYY